MSIRGAKKRERWVKSSICWWCQACMCVPVLATWIRLWCLFLDGAQGQESWVGAQPKPCTVCFSALSWANKSLLPAVTFPGSFPALGQEVKSQRVSSRTGKPKSPQPHGFPLLWPCEAALPGQVLQGQRGCKLQSPGHQLPVTDCLLAFWLLLI